MTCCALRIEADGSATIANAGHLPPYWNGAEVEVDSGLPLGIDAGAEYSETRFAVEEAGHLTLVSDGVVEARSAVGELFGFERTRMISGEEASAIAAAAKAFGQEDDITVLTVARRPLPDAAAADQAEMAISPATA